MSNKEEEIDVLSTVSSLYNPFGFIAQVISQGKIILKIMVSETTDSGEIISDDYREQWKRWLDPLTACGDRMISRTIELASLPHSDSV